jgi:hypothetical protein
LVLVVREPASGRELLEEPRRRHVFVAHVRELGGIARWEREQLRPVYADDVLGVAASDLGRYLRAGIVAVRAVALVAEAMHEPDPGARHAPRIPAGFMCRP